MTAGCPRHCRRPTLNHWYVYGWCANVCQVDRDEFRGASPLSGMIITQVLRLTWCLWLHPFLPNFPRLLPQPNTTLICHSVENDTF